MPLCRPPLTVEQVLSWADAHHQKNGRWPNQRSGPVEGAGGESWLALDCALRLGGRGLPGSSTLKRLLAEHRSVPGRAQLSCEQILSWADAHRRRTGRWPTAASGRVLDAPSELWRSLDTALRRGFRGLPRGDGLAELLDRERSGARRTWRHAAVS
jgi:hypothetical protein